MKILTGVLLLGCLLCISAIYQTQNFGLPGASPVGPYINGALPSQTTTNPQGSANLGVVKATPNLSFNKILSITPEPGTNNIFVTDRYGHVYAYDDHPQVGTATLFLDLTSVIWTNNGTIGHVQETGIYNIAFHPEYNIPGSPNRNYFYLFYTAEISGLKKLRISRFTRPTGSSVADPNSELLLIDQYLFNNDFHRGGGLEFGNDGFLYIALGDQNDQTKTQQNTDYLCSGVLRIDVDMDPVTSHPIRRTLQSFLPNSFSGNYFIPYDNPWQHANGTILEEYYAIGLRNPHRMTHDPVTGTFFIGDVGHQGHADVTEEINVLARGANYGWPFREGVTNVQSVPSSYIGTLVDPAIHYPHGQGNNCVIGGYVYRGSQFPSLYGKYIFGDYGSSRIWQADVYSGQNPIPVSEIDIFQNGSLVTFGLDHGGEILLANAHTSQEIFRLEGATGFISPPPYLLSQTGAFTQTSTLTPAAFMIPYDVNAPLYSDGAVKKRWFILPNDGTMDDPSEQITYTASGEWKFPVGAVLVKHFELPLDASNPGNTKRLETRFLVHGANGEYYGLTYKWDANGQDATLLQSGASENITVLDKNGNSFTQTWTYPSPGECFICHTQAAGRVLGPKTRQLDGSITYPSTGITAHQLATLNNIGAFNFDIFPVLTSHKIVSRSLSDSTAMIQDRALSYLDANCSSCHRENSTAVSNFEALLSTPLDQNGMINGAVFNDLGIPNAKVITPGDTATSILYQRLRPSLGCCRMPAIGVTLEDTIATRAIADWIMSMGTQYTPCATQEVFVSDMPIVSSTNGEGPVELDSNNGNNQPGDGGPISLGGTVYPKGLGVHANSEVVFNLNGAYDEFRSTVGLDDSKNSCSLGSIQFFVYGDNTLLLETPVINRGDDPLEISVAVAGVNQLKLVVDSTADHNYCDHASWGGARVIKFCDDPCTAVGQPCDDQDICTVNDRYNSFCDCIGDFADNDNDGICDALDPLPFPVEWLSFEGKRMGEDVKLDWATLNETENSKFLVLRSWDGQDFEQIGTVEGSGTVLEVSEYSYTDPLVTHFSKEKIYYRLGQVDLDGTTSYSETVLIELDVPDFRVYAFPTLFRDAVQIETYQGQRRGFGLKIINPLGQEMWRASVSQPSETFKVPTTGWSDGIYFLIYSNGDQGGMKKLIKGSAE